jgi:hypothetical protein
MKPRHFPIAAAVVLGAAAFLLWTESEIPPAPEATVTTATADGMELTTATDPESVFKKAFWRRPAGNDKIRQAERREWSSEDGVQKWQWFIAVSPGPELLEWLKTNPFSLATTQSTGSLEKPPEWFPKPSSGFLIQKNAEGRFILMLSTDQKQLYATDSGSGFAPPKVAP